MKAFKKQMSGRVGTLLIYTSLFTPQLCKCTMSCMLRLLEKPTLTLTLTLIWSEICWPPLVHITLLSPLFSFTSCYEMIYNEKRGS